MRRRAEDEGVAAESEVLFNPLAKWLSGDPGRAVLFAGYLLIVAQALLRSWVKLGGWFYGDDLSFIGRANTLPFWSKDYLLVGWYGHLMPGAFVQVRALNEFWPYNYAPVAIVDLLLQALVSLLVLRLLTNLFGPRPEILIPLTIFVLSPITLPAFVWWAAALNQLWGQLAMVLALLSLVAYHRTGRRRAIVGVVSSIAFGMLFSEKVLLVLPVLFALTFLYFTPGPPLGRLRRAVSENRVLWSALLLLGLAYTLTYMILVTPPSTSSGNFSGLNIALVTIGNGITHAVLPGLFGGPFTWQQLGTGGVANPSGSMVVVFALCGVLTIWASVARRVRASFAWIVITGYVLVNATILGLTRATLVGPLIGAEYRYHTDSLMVIVVFGSLAFLPVHGGFARGQFQPLLRRVPVGQRYAAFGGFPVAPAVGAVVCVLAVAFTISTVRYDPLWRDQQAERYYSNVRDDIAASKSPITILNLPQTFTLNTTSSELFRRFQPKPSFLLPGRSADELFLPDPQGHLRLADVRGRVNKPGPEPGCGVRIGSAGGRVALDSPTAPWQWVIRIGYISTYDVDTTVTAGTTRTPVHLRSGLHHVFVMGTGALDSVSIGPVGYGSVCTNDVAVGFAEPLPGTSPAGVYGAATRN